ncbi:PREDICTED: scar-like domain-containing protein WAVE 5 isoform X2 [Camelina sativa]|nr:PREDICTED: scar-like domain-containing protein WAVE 5 isoform X2 [Camelina sativa]
MESYEQCRDPPPLHLLDRFAIGGPGSCLRKYSDPTFFRKELGNPNKADDIKVQRDQAHRKRKKKRLPQRNICRSNAVSTSDETNGAHLSSVTDDRQTTSQSTSTVDMPRSSNMQDLSDIIDQSQLQDAQEQSEAQVQSDFQDSSKARDSITGSGYIEYVINQSPVNEPEVKLVEGYLSGSVQPAGGIGSVAPEGCIVVVDDNILYNPSEDLHGSCASVVPDKKKETYEPMEEKSSKVEQVSEIHESKFGPETPDRVRQNQRDFDRTHILLDEVDIVREKESKSQANNIDEILVVESEEEDKSEQGSEVDEFVDARNTIESESDSDLDGVPKPKLEHYFGDVSTYCSEDANSDNNDGSEEDIPYEQMAHDLHHENPLDESCSGSCLPNDANVSCRLSDPVCGKIQSHDETFQKPWEFFAMCPSLLAEEAFPNIAVLREEPVAEHPVLAGDSSNEIFSSEDPTSLCQSLKDAIPAEKTLPEEHLANYPSLAEAVIHEKSSPGESVAKFPSFTERMELSSEDWPRTVRDVPGILPQEKILPVKSLPKTLAVAESVSDTMTQSGEPDAVHPSFPNAIQEKKISPEVIDSKNLSVPEADSHEKISLEESVGIYPCLVKSVPDERFLTEELEEPATTEELLEGDLYLAELPKEKVLLETFVGSTRPSCAKAGPEANPSSEVLTSTNLSVTEAVPQEQISLEEFVGVNPYFAEAIPDERFSPEEPVTTHLKKSVAIEKVLAEELLETYPSLEELPEEKISHEETYDATDPSEAVSDEDISSEVSNSTNLSLEEVVPQEQISLDEFVGRNPCLAEAIPDESFLQDEHVTTCLSLTKVAAIEGVLPEKPLETYLSLAELSKEKILHAETNDATHPSEAVRDEEISSEVSDSTNLSLEEALPQEQMSLEEFVGINPCLTENIPNERLWPEEPVTPYLFSTKAAEIKGILPEKPLETYPSLAELAEEKIFHKEGDDATYPSLFEAVSDEQILPEPLDSTNLLVAEAVPQEQISVEECVGRDPCFTEAILDKRVLPEEPVTTCMSLTKVVPIEEVLPEEALETYASLEQLPKNKTSLEKSDDTKHPSCAKTESDGNIAPEVLDSTSLSVAEAIPQMQCSFEELYGIDPFLAKAVTDERISPEEPITTCLSLANAAPIEIILPEEAPEVYPSLEESQEEEFDDGTHPSFSEAVGDEKISQLEGPGSTYPSLEESVPREKTLHEEPVSTNPFLAVAVPDERILSEEPVTTCLPMTKAAPIETIFPEESLEVYPSLEESQEEKILQEEELDDDTHPSFFEAVGHEKISSLEDPDSTYPSLEESVPDEKTSHEELVSTNPFLELAVPNERSFLDEPGLIYQSLAEAVSKENNLPEEPLPTYSSLAEAVCDEKISLEEPDASCPTSAEAVFDENISGSEAPVSMIETGPHNKVFPEEPFAMDSSLAEAGFHEKIPDAEAPGSTTETGPHNKTFPELHVPDGDSLPKEPVATYLALAEGIPDQKVFLDDAALLLFAEAIFDQKFSPEVPDTTYPSLKEPEMHVAAPSLVTDLPAKNILVKEGEAYDESYPASDVSMNQKTGLTESESAERTIPLSGGTVTISSDTRESLSNGTNVESVSIWSNGGLLGLAPLKPPVFAEPNSVSEHLQNEINKASVLSTRKQESASRSVENTEKSSLPLVVSDPASQQHSNMLSPSHLQSTGTSFRVFGLSHRLLMAGFRGNSSSSCKFESLPSSSYNTGVAAENKSQQTRGDSSYEEQLDYESSLFGSPTSSPLVEHMKISFNPKDASPVPKLKLRIPSQPQYNGENADMFPTFQLVPEASNSDDDDNSDTFCQSSPCVSDNCLSDSELWESDESPKKSISSLKHVGERSRHGDMGSFSGSFLDLPCYDAVDHQSTSSRLEQEPVPDYKPSVLEIIRDWPPNQPKSSPSNEANTVLKNTQDQSPGLLATDDGGER